MGETPTTKKYRYSVILLVLLIICLCITSFALAYANLVSRSNLFTTATVQLSLHDGAPVFNDVENIEPGATFEREFFVKNVGTADVYYKLYFQNVQGELSKYLVLTLKDGNNVLYQGAATDFTKDNAVIFDNDDLAVGEKRCYTLSVYLPKEAGNSAQNLALYFDFTADAVQSKNNPNKLFE